MTLLTRIIFPSQVLDFLHTCVLKIIETNPQKKQNRSFSHILRNMLVIHIPVIKKCSISPIPHHQNLREQLIKGTNHLQKQLRLLFKNISGTDIITVKDWQKTCKYSLEGWYRGLKGILVEQIKLICGFY